MLEAYSISATFTLRSNAAEVLEQIASAMERFDGLVRSGQESLSALARDLGAFRGAGSAVSSLVRAMERLDDLRGGTRAAEGMDRVATATREALTASEQLGRAMGENVRYASESARAMETAAKAAEEGGRTYRRDERGRFMGAGGGPGGGGGGSGGGGRLGGHGGEGHDWMMTGMAAEMVGDPLIHATELAYDHALDVAHMRQQIASDTRLGPTQEAREARADKVIDAAYAATASAPGTRVAKNLEAAIDLKQITGSLDEAEALLPRFARMSALLSVMDRRSGGTGDPAFAAAKAMEIMGEMIETKTRPDGSTSRELNPEKLQDRLDMMTRVAVASNMRVAPETYLSFAKQARVAGMTLSDEFIYQELPSMLMTTGGPRIGTALMSMAQIFQGGHLTDKAAEAMVQAGLASPDVVRLEPDPTTGKQKKVVDESKVFDLALMGTDPMKYAEATSRRLDAKGIHGDAQVTEMLRVAQRSTVAGLLAELIKDMPSIKREQQNVLATNPNVAGQLAERDPAAKLQQFQAAWDKLLTSFGSAMMGDATTLISKATAALNAMGDWAHKNPNMARILGDTAAGIGAVAVAMAGLSTAVIVLGPALRLLTASVSAARAAAAGGGALSGVGTALAAGSLTAAAGAGVDALRDARDSVLYGGKGTAMRDAVDAMSSHSIWDWKTWNGAYAAEDREALTRARSGGALAPGAAGGGPGSAAAPIAMTGSLNVDGKRLGTFTAKSIAQGAAAPPSGISSSDVRIDPFLPGVP